MLLSGYTKCNWASNGGNSRMLRQKLLSASWSQHTVLEALLDKSEVVKYISRSARELSLISLSRNASDMRSTTDVLRVGFRLLSNCYFVRTRSCHGPAKNRNDIFRIPEP